MTFSFSTSLRCCTPKQIRTGIVSSVLELQSIRLQIAEQADNIWMYLQEKAAFHLHELLMLFNSERSENDDALPTAADDQRGLSGKGSPSKVQFSLLRGHHAHPCGTSAQKLLLGNCRQSIREFRFLFAGIRQFLSWFASLRWPEWQFGISDSLELWPALQMLYGEWRINVIIILLLWALTTWEIGQIGFFIYFHK